MAEHVGAESVDGMLGRLSVDELVEWMAWERLTGPLGHARQDLQMAHLCCVLANLWRGPKSKAFKIEDFMLFANPLMEKQRSARAITSPETQLAIFKAWASAVDAADLEIKMGESVKGDRI